MSSIAAIGLWVLQVFSFLLFARIILDLVRSTSPSFRPKGIILFIAELIYVLTDWVLKPISKVIKPIRVGSAYLDLSIFSLFFIIFILESLLLRLH